MKDCKLQETKKEKAGGSGEVRGGTHNEFEQDTVAFCRLRRRKKQRRLATSSALHRLERERETCGTIIKWLLLKSANSVARRLAQKKQGDDVGVPPEKVRKCVERRVMNTKVDASTSTYDYAGGV